ncbi:MAG: SCO family protein [Planctomycetes bacterium]|nr:SCO family protein [Planctomycetota bacterium]
MTGRPTARAWLGLLALALTVACSEAAAPVQGAGSSGPRTDPHPEDPASFGALPEFHLTTAQGAALTLAELRGRPLVIGALYSTCTGPCPSVARGLQALQRELADTDVLLLVVSVDPAADTPEVLARYAARLGADPARWIFLTGTDAEVQRFVREGLWLPYAQQTGPDVAPGERVTHDVRLLAVDRAGVRRGWYEGTDENQVERLARRMLHLAGEAVAR